MVKRADQLSPILRASPVDRVALMHGVNAFMKARDLLLGVVAGLHLSALHIHRCRARCLFGFAGLLGLDGTFDFTGLRSARLVKDGEQHDAPARGIIIAIALNRYIVRGVTAGAVK